MRHRNLFLFVAGIFFGFVLSRSGASDFRLIHAFFTGRDFTVAGIMAIAIATACLGMRLLKIKNISLSGEPLRIDKKGLHRFSLAGAALFGLGWGMTGSCPGTILVQVGEGKVLALFTLSGLAFGTWLFSFLLDVKKKK